MIGQWERISPNPNQAKWKHLNHPSHSYKRTSIIQIKYQKKNIEYGFIVKKTPIS